MNLRAFHLPEKTISVSRLIVRTKKSATLLPLKAVPNISGRTCTSRPIIVRVSFEGQQFSFRVKHRYHFFLFWVDHCSVFKGKLWFAIMIFASGRLQEIYAASILMGRWENNNTSNTKTELDQLKGYKKLHAGKAPVFTRTQLCDLPEETTVRMSGVVAMIKCGYDCCGYDNGTRTELMSDCMSLANKKTDKQIWWLKRSESIVIKSLIKKYSLTIAQLMTYGAWYDLF